MPVNRSQASKLLSASEMTLFDAGSASGGKSLTAAQLKAKVDRTRKLRDKARDLYKRQRLSTRDRTGSKQGRTGIANDRTRQKAQLLDELLKRLQAKLAKAGKTATKKPAKNAGSKKSSGKKAATKKSTAKKSASKKTAAKKLTAKKSAGKKTAAKKSTAKKSPAKKTAVKKAATKKTATKKAATKKTSAEKTSAKKIAGTKSSAKQSPAKTGVGKKAAARKSTARKATGEQTTAKKATSEKAASKQAASKQGASGEVASKNTGVGNAAGKNAASAKAPTGRSAADKPATGESTRRTAASGTGSAGKSDARADSDRHDEPARPAHGAAARAGGQGSKPVIPPSEGLFGVPGLSPKAPVPLEPPDSELSSNARTGFMSKEAKGVALDRHFAESRGPAIHGHISSTGRRNQGKRDQKG